MCTAASILPFRIRISSLLTSLQLPSAYFLLALHFNVPCQDLLVAIHVVLDLSIGFEGWPVLKDRWYSKLFNLLIRKYAIKCNDFVNFLQLSQSVSWGLLPVLDWLNLRLNGCLLFNTFHALLEIWVLCLLWFRRHCLGLVDRRLRVIALTKPITNSFSYAYVLLTEKSYYFSGSSLGFFACPCS